MQRISISRGEKLNHPDLVRAEWRAFSVLFLAIYMMTGVMCVKAEPASELGYISATTIEGEGSVMFAEVMKQMRTWAAADANDSTDLPASFPGNLQNVDL